MSKLICQNESGNSTYEANFIFHSHLFSIEVLELIGRRSRKKIVYFAWSDETRKVVKVFCLFRMLSLEFKLLHFIK